METCRKLKNLLKVLPFRDYNNLTRSILPTKIGQEHPSKQISVTIVLLYATRCGFIIATRFQINFSHEKSTPSSCIPAIVKFHIFLSRIEPYIEHEITAPKIVILVSIYHCYTVCKWYSMCCYDLYPKYPKYLYDSHIMNINNIAVCRITFGKCVAWISKREMHDRLLQKVLRSLKKILQSNAL